MKVHELKLVEPYLTEVLEGRKTFEIRKNDRDFQEGDILHLKGFYMSSTEFGKIRHPEGYYTGAEAIVKVTYMLEDFVGMLEGYVAMSIKLLDKEDKVTFKRCEDE